MSPLVKSTSRPTWQRIPAKNVFYYRCPDHQKNYVLSFAFAFDREDDVYQVSGTMHTLVKPGNSHPTVLSPPIWCLVSWLAVVCVTTESDHTCIYVHETSRYLSPRNKYQVLGKYVGLRVSSVHTCNTIYVWLNQHTHLSSAMRSLASWIRSFSPYCRRLLAGVGVASTSTLIESSVTCTVAVKFSISFVKI